MRFSDSERNTPGRLQLCSHLTLHSFCCHLEQRFCRGAAKPVRGRCHIDVQGSVRHMRHAIAVRRHTFVDGIRPQQPVISQRGQLLRGRCS